MSNSKLVSYTKLSPNHSGKRTHKIDRITPHCVVGQLTASGIAACFASKSRQASCQYGIGKDGAISLIVDEANRSWCTSSNANDQRAVTIECASNTTHPYAMNTAVYNSLVKLCVDICKRNGKKKLLWFSNKSTALNYSPKSDEMVLTVNRWFANKACPGDWLFSRLGTLASTVTKQLGGSSSSSSSSSKPSSSTYKVWVGKVTASSLNVRTGPGAEYSRLSAWPQLGKGNLVDVLGTAKAKDGGTWYKIRIAAKYDGYVNSAYLKKA